MCGFLFNSFNIDFKQIEKAIDKISYRGDCPPQNLSIDNKWFSHVRLKITGLDDGQQPLISHDQQIIALINGEFYGWKEIKKDLMKEGFRFKTQTDSEIVIPLYQKYGMDFISHLNGEFSGVIYDRRNKDILIFRDRFGIKPIHYFLNDEKLIVASEAKAITSILNSIGIKSSLNESAYSFSQHFQYLPMGQTLFEHIKIVEPAQIIKINLHEKINIKNSKIYWYPNYHEKNLSLTFQDASDQVDHLLSTAINKRIPKEVPFCSHISGGIDSSAVAYYINQFTKDFDLYTVSFEDAGVYDELLYAQDMAQHLGIDLNYIQVDSNQLMNSMSESVYVSEGISINGHFSAKQLLAKKIRQNNKKVYLSGEGSDEIFMGYAHLKQDFKQEITQQESKILSGIQISDGHEMPLKYLQEKLGYVPNWIKAKSSISYKLSKLWGDKINFNQEHEYHFIKEIESFQNYHNLSLKELRSINPCEISSLLWMRYCLSGYILKTLDDGQSASNQLEGRVPFLDNDLVSFVNTIPVEFHFKNNKEKSILRNIMKNRLPDSIVNKGKQPFLSPPIHASISSNSYKDIILNSNLFDKNIFSRKKVEKYLKNINNDVQHEPIVMMLITSALWLKHFK